jgi:hypothetical protein
MPPRHRGWILSRGEVALWQPCCRVARPTSESRKRCLPDGSRCLSFRETGSIQPGPRPPRASFTETIGHEEATHFVRGGGGSLEHGLPQLFELVEPRVVLRRLRFRRSHDLLFQRRHAGLAWRRSAARPGGDCDSARRLRVWPFAPRKQRQHNRTSHARPRFDFPVNPPRPMTSTPEVCPAKS